MAPDTSVANPRTGKERALEVIEFIGMLKHTGDFYGKPFTLLPWQHELLWNVYGTVKDSGLRQYQFAYLEAPKKQGKTELIAALLLYHIVCDGPDGQIYCCAAEQWQAGNVYRAALVMISQNDALKKLLKTKESVHEIINTQTKTRVKVLSAEAYSKHGLNPTVVIFDELHAQPNRELWDVMTFGAGAARREPLWWVITTAGDDPDRKSVGWEQHEYARGVIAGTIQDPRWYAMIYGAPDNADIYDEAVWAAANPSLGVTVPIETIRAEAITARNSEPAEKLFRWLRLNQWVALKHLGWLPLSLWDKTQREWDPTGLVGKYCYIGLDLASTTDLTALALLFPPQKGLEEWRCLFKTYIPMENMKERVRRDKVPYDEWARAGYITVTEGTAVDYETIQLQIEAYAKQYKVKWLCADKWNSRMMTQALAKKNIKTVEIDQTIAGLSPGTKELERLLRTDQITHLKDPVARWAFGNAAIATDGNENIKLMKNRSVDRIDPMFALVDAMSAAMKLEKIISAYEDHGIRMV